jgi:hypothetical protein
MKSLADLIIFTALTVLIVITYPFIFNKRDDDDL